MWLKALIILIFVLNSGLFYSQDCKVDLATLPQIESDNSFSQLNKVFEQSSDCNIVFSDGFDTARYKKVSNRLTSWFLNDKTKKKYQFASSVSTTIPGDQYLIIGMFKDFQNLKSYKLPLEYKKGIWSFGKIPINENKDAIVIINKTSDCLAVLGNSYESIESISFRWLGFFDFYILKNNSIKYFGNLSNGKFNPNYLVDIDQIRKDNYPRLIENDFIKARFSCSFSEPNNYKLTLDSLNLEFQKFCDLFKINMPPTKLDYFIHNNPSELNLICGSPRPGTTAGLVIDGLIHSVGMNLDLLTHEGIHYIFLNSIKYRDTFFNEGIPGFFSLYQNPEGVSNDSKLILNYIDYDFKALIMGQIDFFRGPYKNGQCLSYPISGLFVKYLIDTYGIDKTLEFYKESNLEIAFQNAFSKSVDMIIPDWKQWLIKN